MAFAALAVDSTWATRIAADIVRPAVFVFLDWPTGDVFASTHHKSVTIGPDTWAGVGNVGFIEAGAFGRNGALVTYKIGLASLPQDAITDATEAAAIGRSATVYMGLFDTDWTDPILHRIFEGHILTAGDFSHNRDKKSGDWLTTPSIEISNGRNPRRQLQNHHSPESAEGTDTAWRLLASAARQLSWPN